MTVTPESEAVVSEADASISREFKREDRYRVIKLASLNALHIAQLDTLLEPWPTVKGAVVVESDWPEYEPVWSMIEARCTGAKSEEPDIREALRQFIYETTHLSPREDDGSHWCSISSECLENGRKAYHSLARAAWLDAGVEAAVAQCFESKDNCQLCYGANGGVKGNENRVGELVVCDYCTIKLSDYGITTTTAEARSVARDTTSADGEVLIERGIVDTCVQIEANRWPENEDVQKAIAHLQRRLAALQSAAKLPTNTDDDPVHGGRLVG